MFDPNRVDSTIEVGTIEQWTVNNASQELHAFHIHQIDFQVLEINGVPQPFVGRQDSVNVPFQPDDASPPGQVKLLMDFRNPIIEGRFVYHCHILEHEDGGMMAVAEVVAPGASGMAPSASQKVPASRIQNTLSAFQAGSVGRTPAGPPRLAARNGASPSSRAGRP